MRPMEVENFQSSKSSNVKSEIDTIYREDAPDHLWYVSDIVSFSSLHLTALEVQTILHTTPRTYQM